MLLGYKKRFEEPIQIGTKVFTMRNKRKVMPKIGETLYMYTGLRTSKCSKISDKETLISMQEARVFFVKSPNQTTVRIWVDSRELADAEIKQFVKYDGFADVNDFTEYWCASSTGKPFSAKKHYRLDGFLDLYHWTDLKY